MPSIKFNYLTKETELEGSESFIESNFDKIQDLLIENFGVKRKMVSRMTKAKAVEVKESQADAEIKRHELPEGHQLSSSPKPSFPEISSELKAKRAPLRKYIRKEGIPGHERIVVEVVEQKPRELSLASLKEKFGLSDSKIGGIIRDADKYIKRKRVMNGSYVWLQD
jgi:hypothetical protein